MDWQIITGSLPLYASGIKTTLVLLVLSLASSFVISVPLAVARVSSKAWLSRSVWLYTYVLRGTPLLVQLFILYHGLAQFEAVRESAAWVLLRNAWFCAWLAFTLNSTAYTTEIFAGALKATNPGEIEAARAYGLGGLKLYTRILLPSALRRALPQYSNEVVGLMHATAIASTVTLVDITRVARDVYANHLLVTESFGVAAVIYFILTFTLVGGFKLLERHFLRHLRSESRKALEPATPLIA
ncbi:MULTISPECIES: ABC transporter permease [unclassified Polaromonas]|uniref:ABC transporter permease n=1 Tax=unclassified Polaromonas TaxID=2638319 RepID=UPI000F08EE35|nr:MULTISPECIES: ABC transporter permease [unclassified Polaromonas]AYQ28507.1 ABC transporter permease subunit [Polaromonas sp. SP1]QGJ20376.1 ABC transporter permease subunit [Polaromonas sp. Pch-P]